MSNAIETERKLPLPVYVDMVGQDGNAFSILGRVKRAIQKQLRELEWDRDEIKVLAGRYFEEATSGDYDHLLQTSIRWVHTDEDPPEDVMDAYHQQTREAS